jgi:hypothetical protein
VRWREIGLYALAREIARSHESQIVSLRRPVNDGSIELATYAVAFTDEYR